VAGRQIEAAIGSGLASCNGAKDANVICAVLGRNMLDFFSFLVYELLDCHHR
jgi:hypothetical protein